MKNRLIAVTEKYQRTGEKLFCAFLTLGYPNLCATARLIRAFEKEGVDIIELGFPFSDPLADGPTIQYSSAKALSQGVKIEHAFSVMRKLRQGGVRLPVLFFSYYNPILRYGAGAFLQRARRAGFDGLIIPDLPPDEERDFHAAAKKSGLAQVFLVSPTTEEGRIQAIVRKSEGFIYYVSLRGVTGARKRMASDIRSHLKQLTGKTRKPVLVGFGVSTAEQARYLSAQSAGVIVGSAIINELRRARGKVKPVLRYVGRMIRAVKGMS